jgi:hypothetical protein
MHIGASGAARQFSHVDEAPPEQPRRPSATGVDDGATGRATDHDGAANRTETGVTSMIRKAPLMTTESDVEDRSMRVVEYVLAFLAMVAAGILAFIR